MNRRLLAVVGLVVALALFAAPLVSPIPDQEPHVRVSVGSPQPDPVPAEYGNVAKTTYRYQTLSVSAQQFFDTQAAQTLDDEKLIHPAAVPAPWVSSDNATPSAIVKNSGQVLKQGQYYPMYMGRVVPQPPLVAVVLRFGSLVAAIGLGTVAGYFSFTTEN